MPIYADWPEAFYKDPSVHWYLIVNGEEWPVLDTDICVGVESTTGPLRILFVHAQAQVELELELFEDDDGPNYRFRVLDNHDVQVRRGESSVTEPAAQFFYGDPPFIGFSDGSLLEGNDYVPLKHLAVPYDAAKIDAWDWTGINIQAESQGDAKEPATIQARVIAELKKSNYSVIFDDDAKGEAADVVAVSLVGDPAKPDSIDVDFYHCKFSLDATPGHRVKDLYEVCGQAQKSISWFLPERRTEIFTHMLRRESDRHDAGRPTRIEFGDADVIHTIREMSHFRPVRLRVFIVQPGLAKEGVPTEHLQLLSVTENHLFETYQIPFGVIASQK